MPGKYKFQQERTIGLAEPWLLLATLEAIDQHWIVGKGSGSQFSECVSRSADRGYNSARVNRDVTGHS